MFRHLQVLDSIHKKSLLFVSNLCSSLINGTQHKNTKPGTQLMTFSIMALYTIMLIVVMLSVIFTECRK
jgi:hypothetical protein